MTASLLTTAPSPKQIAPGLTIDDGLYTTAAAGVAEHVPELGPLSWDRFTSTDWTLIPDEQTGEAYKAELTLFKSSTRTIRMNLWFAPDLRDNRGPRPHNHPWDFHSVVLDGAYVESRWTLHDGIVVPQLDVEHRAGEVNQIGREAFHEVTEIDPGRTLTLMICGPGMAGWGYLDPATAAFTTAELPARFMDRLRQMNPHQN